MEIISLINAGIVVASIQGCTILWQKKQYQGICFYLMLVSVAAIMNILDDNKVTFGTFNVTPVFQLLFGPAFYLASLKLINRNMSKIDGIHFIPALIALVFTSYSQLIIALGTFTRVAYSILTIHKLNQYKRKLDFIRSDSDEYSFRWLIYLLLVTALFNLIDLARLNLQPFITNDINAIGQATNNTLWLLVIVALSYKLNKQELSPLLANTDIDNSSPNEVASDYSAIYEVVDKQVKSEQLFRTERLTLSQLSETLGLQQRDVSRAINLNANKTFNEYINELRVAFVCELLNSGTKLSITEVAFEAGFSSKAVFNRSFKQVIGSTPSQYKSRQQ